MNKFVMALGMAGALLTAGLVALPVQASKAVSAGHVLRHR